MDVSLGRYFRLSECGEYLKSMGFNEVETPKRIKFELSSGDGALDNSFGHVNPNAHWSVYGCLRRIVV
jgi:hypothetical protein